MMTRTSLLITRKHFGTAVLWAVGILALLSPQTLLSSTSGGTVYGPQRFNRTAGAPNYYKVTFTVPGWANGPYVLQVQNGAPTGENRVSSAWVEVNDAHVLDNSDLNQGVAALDRPVVLGRENKLEVKVAGGPGSYIIIRISALSSDTLSPVVGIISPANGSVIKTNTPRLQISYSDPTPACQQSSGYHHASYPHRDDHGRFRRGHFDGDGCEDGDDEWRNPHWDDHSQLRPGHYVGDACRGGKEKSRNPHWDDHGRLRPGHHDNDDCQHDCSAASGLDLDTFVVLLDGADRTNWFTKRAGEATALVPATDSLSSGSHRLEATIADEAGNLGHAVSVFSVDFARPQLHISQPIAGSYSPVSLVGVSVTFSDVSGIDLPTLTMTVNGTDSTAVLSVTPAGASGTIGPLSDGANTVVVSVKDLAGNPVSDSVTFNVDTVAPTISILQPANGSRHGAGVVPVSVQFNDAQGVEPTSLQVQADGQAVAVNITGNVANGQLEALPDGPHTITATIRDKAGHTTNATPSVFTIDTKAPTLTISAPSAGALLNTSTPTIVVDYSDNDDVDIATVKITINGTDRTQAFDIQAKSARAESLSLPDGTVTIVAELNDATENKGTASSSFAIDTVPPVAQFEGVPSVTKETRPLVTLKYSDTGSGVDPDSVHILLDETDVTGSFSKVADSASGTLPVVSDGPHTLTAKVADEAGNRMAPDATASLVVDTVAPVLTIEAPADNSFTNDNTPAFTIHYSDPGSQIDVNSIHVELEREGVPAQDVTSYLEIKEDGVSGNLPPSLVLSDGTYEVTVDAKDRAGNAATVKAAFEVDTVPPRYTVTSPSSGFANSSLLSVSVQYDDDRSGIDPARTKIIVDGVDHTSELNASGHEITGTLTLPSTDTHKFEVAVFDRAGNAGAGNGPIQIVVDATLPTILPNISPSKNSAGWYNEAVTITFTCADEGGSGVASCPQAVTLDQEGANQQVNVVAIDNAGNQTPWSQSFNIDKTAPIVTAVLDPPANEAGWNKTSVRLTFECVDTGSGVSPTCPFAKDVITEGESTFSGTVTDLAGNSVPYSVTVKIDETAPTLVGVVSPAPNPAGWSSTDVVVSFECSDALSGVIGCPVPQPVTTEGANQVISATVTDRAGNPASKTITVSIDKGIPSITGVVEPLPNDAHWNNTDVTVKFNCTAGPSGVASCTAPIPVATEGKGQKFTGTVVSGTGQTNSIDVLVNIDKTKPLISALATPEANAAGWNNSAISVSFQCSDALSGIATCPVEPLTFTGEGRGQVAAGVSSDIAGNIADVSLPVNIDLTAPQITARPSPDANGAGWNNEDVTVSFECSDALSGVPSCPQPQTVAGEGANQKVTQVAVDVAGNTSPEATVFLNIDKTAPTLEIDAPLQLAPGQTGTIGVRALDTVGISRVSISLNGTSLGVLTAPPYQLPINVPSGSVPGDTLIVQASAMDLADNETAAAGRAIKVIANGVLAGQVLSDSTGLPLKDARIKLLASSSTEHSSDSVGRYSIPVVDDRVFLRIDREPNADDRMPQMTVVEREVQVQSNVGTVPVDARLTPLAPAVTIDTNGGTLSAAVLPEAPGITVSIPAGALQGPAAFRLTPLSGQGLPNLLPLGWSPVAAFDLRSEMAAGTASNVAFTRLPNLPMHLLRYNWTIHGWFMAAPNLAAGADGSLALSLSSTGSYVLAVVDDANPPVSIPEPEQAVSGLVPLSVPIGSSSNGSLKPPFLPASGGVSQATLSVQMPSSVPSGTVVQSVVSESYALRSGTTISAEARLQDLVLYQRPGSAGTTLSAQFPVSPSRTFKVAELASGKVHLDILAGRENVRGQAGGSNPVLVRADDDSGSIAIVAGSLGNDTAVALYGLPLANYLPSSGTFAPIAMYEVDLSGARLMFSAQLSAAIASAVGPGDSMFIAQVIRVNGVPQLTVVSLAQLSGSNVVSTPYPGLKGIVEDGEYVFYRSSTPLAFVGGTATANGLPVGALVQTDSSPFVSLADAAGKYLVAAAPGDVAMSAVVPKTSMAGNASTQAIAGATVSVDLVLTGTTTLATVSPEDGALQVPTTTQITVITTQPVDIGSISSDTLKLYRGSIAENQLVPVHFVTLAGDSGLAIMPNQSLSPGTKYTFAASGLTDIFGAYVSVPVTSFTTKSDVPPVFNPDAITFSFPDANGIVQVTAPAGSLQPGTRILIIDQTSGLVVSFTVGNDGSFSGNFPATINDVLEITVTDPNGGTAMFTRSQFVRGDGTVAVGPGGGTVTGPGGVELRIPQGALDQGTEFKIEAFGADLYPNRPDLPGAQFGAGLKITVAEDVKFKKEAELAFPKPAAAPDGSFYYVYRLLNGPDNTRAFETLDDAFVEAKSGKVLSACFPLAGLIQTTSTFMSLAASKNYQAAFGDPMLGNYAFLMWTYEQTRPGLATVGAITGKVLYPVLPGTPDNQTQDTIYEPVSGATVSRVDDEGRPITATPGSADRTVAKSQPDGTFTLIDATYSGGPVNLIAVADGVSPSTAKGSGFEATVVTDKTAQDQAGPLLKYYRNVAYVPINFPAQAAKPPAPKVTIRLCNPDTKCQPAQNEFGGTLLAGVSMEILAESPSGPIQSITADSAPLSITSPTAQVPVNKTYSVVVPYSTLQTGLHSIDATVLNAAGEAVHGIKNFVVVAAGTSNGSPLLSSEPKITEVSPAENAEGVDVGVFPAITFSEPVRNLPGNVRLVSQDDQQSAPIKLVGYGCLEGLSEQKTCEPSLLSEVRPESGVITLTIQPLVGLKYGTQYKIVFTDQVTDFDDVADPNQVEQAKALAAEHRQRFGFKTYGPETLGGTGSFSSTRAVLLDDRAYLARHYGTTSSYMETYDISDPSTPTLVATGGQLVGYALDIAAEKDVPAVGGNAVVVAHSVGGTEFDLPSNLTLYDVSNDKPTRRAIVSVSASSREGGIATRVVMKRNRAYTTILQRGIQVVDLGIAVDRYDHAAPGEIGVNASTPGMGFATDAVVNVIPVQDAAGNNVRLSDIKVDDILASDGVLRTLVVGTGMVLGSSSSAISFVITDPANFSSGAILWAGNPLSTAGSLSNGQALALGKLADPNAAQAEKPVAVVVGYGKVGTGSTVPVLVVIDISTPSAPVLMGAVALKGSPMDIVLYQKTAVVSTSTGSELYTLSDPANPLYAGTVQGKLGDRLAITSEGLLVTSSFNAEQGGVRTGQIQKSIVEVAAQNFGPCCSNEEGSGVGAPQQPTTAGLGTNITTGNVWFQHTDYALPGLGGGISVVRTWNSQWSRGNPIEYAGMFGDSWRSTYEERLQFANAATIGYWRSDGALWTFTLDPETNAYTVTQPVGLHATLSFDSTASQYTIAFRNGVRREFDKKGYLRTLVDRNGNRTTVSYDAQNRIDLVTDAAGRALRFNYPDPATHQVQSLSDSVGTFTTYEYGSSCEGTDCVNHVLRRVLYPDGSSLNFEYSKRLITMVKDSEGKILEAHTYDSLGRGLSSERADGVDKATMKYSSASTTLVTDSLGNVTEYSHSAIGARRFVSAVRGPGCSSCGGTSNTYFSRDSQGEPMSVTDANGTSTQYVYDSYGNVRSRAVSLSANERLVWKYEYNDFDEVTVSTDPMGNVTTNIYDTRGNLLSVSAPAPDSGTARSVTQFGYDPKGELTSVTDPLKHATTIAYTPAGLVQSVTDAQNNSTTYGYDARGNRTSTTDTAQNVTKFGYDPMNRLTSIEYPGGTSSSFTYDGRGRRKTVTDANTKTTTYAYDDADRMLSVTDALNNVTRYGYDTEGHLKRITDALNRVTSFEYDPQGQVFRTTFPSRLTEGYTYDAVGNLLSKTDRKKQTIRYTYDVLNRLTSKSTGVQYTYDHLSRMTQVSDATGTYGFSYDNMGRLTGTMTAYSFLPGKTFTNGYQYDAASNRTQYADAAGSSVTYGYDELNRLRTLIDSSAGQFTFGYDGLSRRTSLARPNGISTTYNYDNLSRLKDILHQAGGETIDGASYTYDAAGNRTGKTNRLDNSAEEYGYDAIYQLLGVTRGGNPAESYTYDGVGNRKTSLQVDGYTYNESNQLTALGDGTTFAYDANGNMVSKTATGGTTGYTWDSENRLTQVTLPGGAAVSFAYDPFGRRIRKSSGSGATIYVYDGANAVAEYDSSGILVARYTQGAGIDEPLAMQRGGTTSYYNADGLGSVTSLTNAAGTISGTYIYSSFGQTSSTASIANPYQYTGRENDPETGLYYYRARYYSPDTGRFISEDPVRFSAGNDFYEYVQNNPPSSRDPSGLLDVLVWDSTGTAGKGNWGHAAVLLDDGTYISWWPGRPDDPNNPNVIVESGGKHFARNARDPSYAADSANGAEGEGKGPDEDIYINSLDETAIRKWWIEYQKNKIWDSFNRNCSDTVMNALKAGGADRFVRAKGNWISPISPGDVLEYAKKLQIYNHNSSDSGIHFKF